jgi:hypothetical protein
VLVPRFFVSGRIRTVKPPTPVFGAFVCSVGGVVPGSGPVLAASVSAIGLVCGVLGPAGGARPMLRLRLVPGNFRTMSLGL